MEIGDRLPGRQSPHALAPDVARPASAVVDRAGHAVGLLAPGLHDVDLARGSPAAVGVRLGEHPERRPETLSGGQRGPHLESTTHLAEEPLRLEPGRGIGFSAVRLGLGPDRQHAVADKRVLRAVGVILQFVVAPAVEAVLGTRPNVMRPAAGVDRGAVELILPGDEGVGRGRHHGGGEPHPRSKPHRHGHGAPNRSGDRAAIRGHGPSYFTLHRRPGTFSVSTPLSGPAAGPRARPASCGIPPR